MFCPEKSDGSGGIQNPSPFDPESRVLTLDHRPNFRNIPLQNQKADIGTCYVGPTKFVQMMILCWPWPT